MQLGDFSINNGCAEAEVGELMGMIYDCGVDPGLWEQALPHVMEFCGVQTSLIGYRDVVSLETNWPHYCGIDPAFAMSHRSIYGKISPMSGMLLQTPGRAVALDRLSPWDELVESKFYREWAIPQSVADWTSIVLTKSARDVTMMCLGTDSSIGRIDDDKNARIDYLGPHLHRAYKIGKVILDGKRERGAFAETIDGLGAGVLLVDSKGGIVHANPAGQAALAVTGCLQSIRGRLVARNPKMDPVLQRALAAAAQGAASEGLLCFTTSSGERFVLHILPLRHSTRSASGLPLAPIAAVAVCPPDQNVRAPPELLATAFKLTPMELRVLLAIVEAGGVREVADALGVAQCTVKTHMAKIFAKMGVHRQTDLVKVVKGFASPLAQRN